MPIGTHLQPNLPVEVFSFLYGWCISLQDTVDMDFNT